MSNQLYCVITRKNLLSVCTFCFLSLLIFHYSPSFSAEIKPVNVHLDNVKFSDLVRVVFGDYLSRSYVLDKDVTDSPDDVSVNWVKVSAVDAAKLVLDLARSRGFKVETREGVLYFESIKSDNPKMEILIYRPKFRTARYLTDLVSALTNAKALGKRGVDNPLSASPTSPQDISSPTSATSLLDKGAGDLLALNVPMPDMEKVKKLLNDLDVKNGEIMLRAAVYEVAVTKSSGSAMQIISLVQQGLTGSVGVAPLANSNTLGFTGGSFTLLLSALDQDTRFKSVAKPSVRVRSGRQAKFSVGQSVPVLGVATLDKNGNPVQSVTYMPSGDILTVMPDVHDEMIDLDVMQEISSFTATTSGVNNSPTLLQRTVTSSLSVVFGETVIIAGLNDSTNNRDKSRLWGFQIGHVDAESSTEILILLQAEKVAYAQADKAALINDIKADDLKLSRDVLK